MNIFTHSQVRARWQLLEQVLHLMVQPADCSFSWPSCFRGCRGSNTHRGLGQRWSPTNVVGDFGNDHVGRRCRPCCLGHDNCDGCSDGGYQEGYASRQDQAQGHRRQSLCQRGRLLHSHEQELGDGFSQSG